MMRGLRWDPANNVPVVLDPPTLRTFDDAVDDDADLVLTPVPTVVRIVKRLAAVVG